MLTRESLRAYCLALKGAEEYFPFGDDVAVLRVLDKMFALLPVDAPLRISLKCDPLKAQMLRDTFPAVTTGYHLSRKHWNTVAVDGSIPDDEVLEWIDESYSLVVKGLKKVEREALTAPDGEVTGGRDRHRPGDARAIDG